MINKVKAIKDLCWDKVLYAYAYLVVWYMTLDVNPELRKTVTLYIKSFLVGCGIGLALLVIEKATRL